MITLHSGTSHIGNQGTRGRYTWARAYRCTYRIRVYNEMPDSMCIYIYIMDACVFDVMSLCVHMLTFAFPVDHVFRVYSLVCV